MNRFVLLLILSVLGFVTMTWLAFFVVPPWATGLLERGEDLPLPTQIVIAASNFWARWCAFLLVPWLVGLAFLGRRALREVAREAAS